MAPLNVSLTFPIIPYSLAKDYLLFNPDLHDETSKQQQHSNFLMTPSKFYCSVFSSTLSAPWLTIASIGYSSSQSATKTAYGSLTPWPKAWSHLL